MKIKNHMGVLGLGLIAGAALFGAGCASSRPSVTEEKQFIRLHHVANTGDEMDLKKGDAVAMVCAKCRTVLYESVDKPRTRFTSPLEHRHYCPGCKSTIIVTGAGLNLREEVKHTCEACGSDSVFCCATKREAAPTDGMKKK